MLAPVYCCNALMVSPAFSALILSYFRDSSASALTPRQTSGAVPAHIKTHAASACMCDYERLHGQGMMATEQRTLLTALANNSTDHSPCDWQQKESRPEVRTTFVSYSMHQRWDVTSIHGSTENIGPQRDISPNANTICNSPWAVYNSGLTLAPKRCNVHACWDRVKPVRNACPLAQLRLAGHPQTPLLQC